MKRAVTTLTACVIVQDSVLFLIQRMTKTSWESLYWVDLEELLTNIRPWIQKKSHQISASPDYFFPLWVLLKIFGQKHKKQFTVGHPTFRQQVMITAHFKTSCVFCAFYALQVVGRSSIYAHMNTKASTDRCHWQDWFQDQPAHWFVYTTS